MKFALLGIRLLIGAIFLFSAYHKIRHPLFFAYTLSAYQILPEVTVTFVAVTLPWVELLTGLALLLGAVRAGATMALVLLLGFVLAMVSAILRGLVVNCGCYTGWSEADWSKVALDVLLVCLCCVLVARSHPTTRKD